MSVVKVKEYLKKWNLDDQVMEFELSSATVEPSGNCSRRFRAANCKDAIV